jgi:lysophospholipase L1-like esterase
MYEILCFGDSNTWGYSPESGGRFPRDSRWTGVLQHTLGSGYRVIEEGQCGRTTAWDDPVEGGTRNGRAYLAPCLESHAPLDLVILMLGTNDTKKRFSLTAYDIGQCMASLVDLVKTSRSGHDGGAPKLVLVAPPPLSKMTAFADMFEDGAEKSKKLGGIYRDISAGRGCAFLDAGKIISTSPLDGVHFEEAEHGKLGQALARMVKQL